MINYALIDDAIHFYKQNGFEEIEVPWVVCDKAAFITTPYGIEPQKYSGLHYPNYVTGNILVGSAEQSFIDLMLRGVMPKNKFLMATTPCFRSEPIDSISDITKPYFLKTELICFKPAVAPLECFYFIRDSAVKFFKMFLDVEIETTNGPNNSTSCDILCLKTHIELGSYGYRTFEDFSWAYGTGVAEPRLSAVLQRIKNSQPLILP